MGSGISVELWVARYSSRSNGRMYRLNNGQDTVAYWSHPTICPRLRFFKGNGRHPDVQKWVDHGVDRVES